jgi:hypothetical protein
MFTRLPVLFLQHNQRDDTLLPITPCMYKLKAGIAYWQLNLPTGQKRENSPFLTSLQYTLSIITSQLHCFQLSTTNMLKKDVLLLCP